MGWASVVGTLIKTSVGLLDICCYKGVFFVHLAPRCRKTESYRTIFILSLWLCNVLLLSPLKVLAFSFGSGWAMYVVQNEKAQAANAMVKWWPTSLPTSGPGFKPIALASQLCPTCFMLKIYISTSMHGWFFFAQAKWYVCQMRSTFCSLGHHAWAVWQTWWREGSTCLTSLSMTSPGSLSFSTSNAWLRSKSGNLMKVKHGKSLQKNS